MRVIGKKRETYTSTAKGLWTQPQWSNDLQPRNLEWTFSVSGVYSASFTNPPTKAGLSDGVNTLAGVSGFGSNGGFDVYLMADFGSILLINNIHLMALHSSAPGGWGNSYTNGRSLQRSNDGSSWTNIATISGLTDTNSVVFSVGALCRYIRAYYASGYLAVGDFWFD